MVSLLEDKYLLLIKLSPYSPMLNPIENVFSVFKSGVKSYLALHRDDIIRRLRALQKLNIVLTSCFAPQSTVCPLRSHQSCVIPKQHTLSFHARAMDMPVGS
ncbi:LOW QUALITY PROTEIN: Hypothetical protein PHPALM_19289 [Phytophthora palmivora]|uniref:Tc1-like transposase DDE domain-containing protein n=1 Tax=Phytophthora palmivora TaxID=4796 RepID=A0A2P4XHP8_9STRA|nr:LOW QUALITY PROTEIN: Hypothetical protein PHPALM_19289 [Phytophthora palmivora]